MTVWGQMESSVLTGHFLVNVFILRIRGDDRLSFICLASTLAEASITKYSEQLGGRQETGVIEHDKLTFYVSLL